MIMFNLRLAQLEDSKSIYGLRISPEVRNNSLDNSMFTYESHLLWLTRSLSNSYRKLFVVLSGEDFAGVVRVDMDEKHEEALVSIFLEKKFWGTGAGVFGLGEAEKMTKQLYPGLKKFTAQVIAENVASLKFFTKMNYRPYFIELKKDI